MTTRALFVTLWASLALAAPAFGAPDSTSGGVEVPETPTGGTDGGGLPQAGGARTEVQPPGQRTDLSVRASDAGAAQDESPPPDNGDEDVEVEVPVPPAEPQPSPPPQAPASGTGPAGTEFAGTGLASTGFATGLYALLGLGLAAAGLTLLRVSAPARLRRRAERRAAVPPRAGQRHRRRHAPGSARAR